MRGFLVEVLLIFLFGWVYVLMLRLFDSLDSFRSYYFDLMLYVFVRLLVFVFDLVTCVDLYVCLFTFDV